MEVAWHTPGWGMAAASSCVDSPSAGVAGVARSPAVVVFVARDSHASVVLARARVGMRAAVVGDTARRTPS